MHDLRLFGDGAFQIVFFLMIDDGFLRQTYISHVRFGWFNILCLLFFIERYHTLFIGMLTISWPVLNWHFAVLYEGQ